MVNIDHDSSQKQTFTERGLRSKPSRMIEPKQTTVQDDCICLAICLMHKKATPGGVACKIGFYLEEPCDQPAKFMLEAWMAAKLLGSKVSSYAVCSNWEQPYPRECLIQLIRIQPQKQTIEECGKTAKIRQLMLGSAELNLERLVAQQSQSHAQTAVECSESAGSICKNRLTDDLLTTLDNHASIPCKRSTALPSTVHVPPE